MSTPHIGAVLAQRHRVHDALPVLPVSDHLNGEAHRTAEQPEIGFDAMIRLVPDSLLP